MDRAQRSLLAPAIASARVIPNGIDLEHFKPRRQDAARRNLGLDLGKHIVLTVGNTLRNNIWRDFDTALEAMRATVARSQSPTLFLGVGDTAERLVEGQLEILIRPHLGNAAEVAEYYSAADVYLHSSRVDTFPTAVLEAMACGRPVVASAVGGIPEQVVHDETGFLAAAGDEGSMARWIAVLLENPDLRLRFGNAAAERARRLYDRELFVDRYVTLYRKLVEKTGALT
jgi:glycosyltransferase involved in cell wall biosynthesis